MKLIIKLALPIALLASIVASQAITNTAIAVSGTNLVLSWPSYGYETYLIQYRQTLDPGDSWSVLTNAFPANSTNRTTFTLFGLAAGAAMSGDGGNGSSNAMLSSSFVNSSISDHAVGPLVMPAVAAGGVVPLVLYPPGFDLSGFLILDPITGETVNGARYSISIQSPLAARMNGLQATADDSGGGSSPLPMGGPIPEGGPSDNTQGPETGFYRVFHIPNFFSGKPQRTAA